MRKRLLKQSEKDEKKIFRHLAKDFCGNVEKDLPRKRFLNVWGENCAKTKPISKAQFFSGGCVRGSGLYLALKENTKKESFINSLLIVLLFHS